jgi:hypothetical protein
MLLETRQPLALVRIGVILVSNSHQHHYCMVHFTATLCALCMHQEPHTQGITQAARQKLPKNQAGYCVPATACCQLEVAKDPKG